MLKVGDLFDLTQTEHAKLFEGCTYAWEAIPKIAGYIKAHLKRELHNKCEGVAWIGPDVYIGPGTIVEDGAMIKGPAIIGRNCVIRHNAYIRENVIIGDECIIGNSCEIKNAFLLNGCEVPHFNYVGDSILGYQAHLGAGVKISNLKLVEGPVIVKYNGQIYNTGLRKFGALIGDKAQIGCNAVLSPGSIIGKRSIIYPCVHWRGVLEHAKIAKNSELVVPLREIEI